LPDGLAAETQSDVALSSLDTGAIGAHISSMATQARRSSAPDSGTGGPWPQHTGNASATVLVVDDEAENRRAMSRQLTAEGFGVATASSATEAFEILRRGNIDAVLMDIVMPDLDGIEATRLIKQDETLREIPVIVLTGFSDVPARMRALSAGAEEFLARPVERTEMAVRLRNLLRLRATHRELRARNLALGRLLEQESERVAYYERFTRNAFDALTARIAILDSHGTIVSVNEAWRRFMSEQGREFAIGQPYRADQFVSEPDAPRLREGIMAVARGERDNFVLDYAYGSAASPGWFTARVTRFKDSDPSYVVVSHEDVTEEQKTRTALNETETKLEESRQQVLHAQKMESVGRLAGGVAHDFNNMLTSIICFTRFVVDDMAQEDPRRSDLVEVLKAADSAARLTSQLLVFSRRKPLQTVVLDVNAALTSVGRVLRRMLGERIELVILPAEESLCVVFDPGQFDQLIFNLAVNAKDAMPTGGTITLKLAGVQIEAGESLSVGDYVELLVSDTGEGMSADVAARAFEPFFTTKGDRGTGLGLATCYGIAQQAHGSITVQSQPGGGTSFRVLLPRAEDTRRYELQRGAVPSPICLHGTVLVVEDQPVILRTMARALSLVGLTVLEAVSGEDASVVLDAHGCMPDLIVIDMVLPGMSGQRFAERLRGQHPALKVLYVSGYVGDEIQHTVRTDENTAFVCKPFSGRQLALCAAALLAPSVKEAPVSQ
jgi:PAS domain S-box-containing protein